jgi:hypothetical protein
MRILPFALLSLLVPSVSAAPALELKNNDLRFMVSGGSNLRLELRGVPVFREMGLFIIKPGWTGVYLYQDDATPKCEKVSETEGTATYETKDAFARYRFSLEPDAFTIRLDYGPRVAPPVEAQVRAYLNANLFAGARISTGGAVPLQGLTIDSNRILESVSDTTFITSLGPVRVTIEGDTGPFALDDYRNGQAEWARKNPMLWLGANVRDFPKPEGRTLGMTFRFSPPAPAPTLPPVELPARPSATGAARVPWAPDTPVIPRPKHSLPVDAAFNKPHRLPQRVFVVIAPDAAPEERQAAREIVADLFEVWGLDASVRERSLRQGRKPAKDEIVLSRLDGPGSSQPRSLPGGAGPWSEMSGHPGAYVAWSDAQSSFILGRDAAGVYYGAQTLKQLIRADKDGVYLKPAHIVDWPTLEMRGVHWFGGRNSLPFHKRMLERIVGPFKLNTMLYEVDYADWDAIQSPDKSRGMTKADVKEVVRLARERFIEPIPEIETFGNSDWLFVNGQNADIRWKGRERSYDPNNPKSFERIFAAFQEAIDIFKPRYFHIGHDEMTVGEHAIPPPGEPKSAVELIAASVDKLSGWLRGKGLTTMMWGDTALHFPTDAADAGTAKSPEDAVALRRLLPRDVVIADWHYDGDDRQFRSVRLFQDLGHKVVGCTWFDRNNIRNFAAALAREKSLGLIQTTWAGWVMDEGIVTGPNAYQFHAYVLAAEHAWNGGRWSLEELGWDPQDVFTRAWERKPVERSVRKGFTIALSPGAKTTTLAGIAFAVGDPVRLAGGLETEARPAAIRIPLGARKTSQLHFLWSTTVATDTGTPVATLTVAYDDGKTIAVPVEYGRAVFAPSDRRAGQETVSFGSAPGVLANRRWTWTNPRPDQPITMLTLTSTLTEAAPVLEGVTAVDS